jgi:hypothetical protein
MKPETTVVEVYNTSNRDELDDLINILKTYGESLEDYIKIDNNYVIVRDNLSNYKYDDQDDMYHGLDVNVGIASAITSGGRIWMSLLKNNPNYNLYYSDTDSIVIDQPLPSKLLGNEIGLFKLEYILKDAVFLGPKIYAGITKDGQYICKIKGYKNSSSVPFEDMKGLLQKDRILEITHQKWFRNLELSHISLKNEVYSLAATQNKRLLQYKDSVAVSTEALKLTDQP